MLFYKVTAVKKFFIKGEKKMKLKNWAIATISATLMLCPSINASASSSIESTQVDWTMSQSYSANSNNGSGYMYYHVGSSAWFDDVYAYSKTNVASGMTGFASVTLKSDTNQTVTKYSDTIVNNSYIITDNACVSGTDQAENVHFMGARYDVGQNAVGYNYFIY